MTYWEVLWSLEMGRTSSWGRKGGEGGLVSEVEEGMAQIIISRIRIRKCW